MDRIAIVTIVHQSPVILRKWITHHSTLVGQRNLFVIAHGTCPEHQDFKGEYNYLTVPRLFHLDIDAQRMNAVSDFVSFLQHYYDAVLYTDADELLLLDPSLDISFQDHILSDTEKTRAPLFFNIIPKPDQTSLDWQKPILSQSLALSFNPKLCNPCVFYQRPHLFGRHATLEVPHRIDPGLFMFHLKYVDPQLAGHHYDALSDEIGTAKRGAPSEKNDRNLRGWSSGRARINDWIEMVQSRPLTDTDNIAHAGEMLVSLKSINKPPNRRFRFFGTTPNENWRIPDSIAHAL